MRWPARQVPGPESEPGSEPQARPPRVTVQRSFQSAIWRRSFWWAAMLDGIWLYFSGAFYGALASRASRPCSASW